MVEAIKFVAIIYKLFFTVAVIYKLSLTVAVIYKPSLTCRHLHADHSGTRPIPGLKCMDSSFASILH